MPNTPPATSSHRRRLLEYLRPDVVHALVEGAVVQTGGPELAVELERTGYAGYQAAAPA